MESGIDLITKDASNAKLSNKIDWGQPGVYGSGDEHQASVAINNRGIAVNVFWTGDETKNKTSCYYRVGAINIYTKTIAWGASHFYDRGISPAIAINDQGVVIEAHQSEKVGDYRLWSRVGFVDSDSKTIAWGGSNYYDHGNPPAIALNNNNIAVEVHQSQKSGDYSLWSRVGFVDPDHKNIFWGDSNYYDHGNPPAVAIDGDNLVIEVHQSQKTNDYSLWYRTGTVDQDHRTIAWGDSNYYDHGTPPSVAVNNTGTGVVEIHQTEQYLNSALWYHLGYVDYTGKAITWGDSNSCGLGIDSPSIAINDSAVVVEVHEEGGGGALWWVYRVGRYSI